MFARFLREINLLLYISFDCSILQKAGAALEVLKEVLDAVDSQNPEVYNITEFLQYSLYTC